MFCVILVEKEVLDLFFRSASVRHRFDEALESVKALGVPGIGHLMNQWRGKGQGATSGVVRAPWETPFAMQHVQRVLDDGADNLVEQARRFIEAVAEPLKIERINLTQSSPLVK